MSYESSLKAINAAIDTLKANNEKPTQLNVVRITGLSMGTVKQYWSKRNLNDNEWQRNLLQKIKRGKEERSKASTIIKKLIEENNQLKKLNKELMDSAFDKARKYLDEEAKLNFCNWVTGVGRKIPSTISDKS